MPRLPLRFSKPRTASKTLRLLLAAGALSAGRAPSLKAQPGWFESAAQQKAPHGEESPLQCEEGECGPLITEVKFEGREAYRFSDGKTAAVVVPSLGRVMSYGLVGGPNLLFVNPAAFSKYLPGTQPSAWVNWGGDKTWPAPQSAWAQWQKSGAWPPPSAWDGGEHEAEVLSGGKLRVVSKEQPGLGARVSRVYSMSARGELVIEQSIEKVSGGALPLSIWSVTQVAQPDAIFVRAASSTDGSGFRVLSGDEATASGAVSVDSPGVLRLQPSDKAAFKIGVDAPVVALASVKDGVAFVQRAEREDGEYPDGVEGAGFPIEIHNNAAPAYSELEILGPLRTYQGAGSSFAHTVRWSLHKLRDAGDESEVAELLGEG